MQKDFITTVLGGPKVYKGKDMRAAHAHIKLTDTDFDVIVELLGGTLKELGVAGDVIGEIAALLETVRDETLNRNPKS